MAGIKPFAKDIASLCVGVTAFALGDPSGGKLVAMPVAALAAAGLTLGTDKAKATAAKAQKEVLAALAQYREFSEEEIERAAAILAASASVASLDLKRLAKDVHGKDFETVVCAEIVAGLAIGSDDQNVRRIIEACIVAGLAACKADPDFRGLITLELVLELARRQDEILGHVESTDAGTRRIEAMVERLVEQSRSQAPAEWEAHQRLFFDLARTYAKETPNDFISAYLGLKTALEAARDLREGAKLPANSGEQVSAVLRRLGELNDSGRMSDAGRELAAALAASRERVDSERAQHAALLDAAVLQARIENLPDHAAQALLERTRLTPMPAPFETLREVFLEWHDRGQGGMQGFDMRVAAQLARAAIRLAATREEAGMAWNDLGVALRQIGQRESHAETLKSAAQALEMALRHRSKEENSDDWSMTELNLGNVYSTIADRNDDGAALVRAIAAYDRTLEVRDEATDAEKWARVQMNRCAAIGKLGIIRNDAGLLEQAIGGLRYLIGKYDRAGVGFEHIPARLNLAVALNGAGRLHNDSAAFAETVRILGPVIDVLKRTPNAEWYLAEALKTAAVARHVSGDLEPEPVTTPRQRRCTSKRCSTCHLTPHRGAGPKCSTTSPSSIRPSINGPGRPAGSKGHESTPPLRGSFSSASVMSTISPAPIGCWRNSPGNRRDRCERSASVCVARRTERPPPQLRSCRSLVVGAESRKSAKRTFSPERCGLQHMGPTR